MRAAANMVTTTESLATHLVLDGQAVVAPSKGNCSELPAPSLRYPPRPPETPS